MRRVLFFAAISGLFSVPAFCAPYLGKELEFNQPDGSPITVRVWGDEFYIRAETLDGYSLVCDPVSGFICYAKVNNEGSDFISTGIPYTGQTVEELKYSGLWPLTQGNGIKKGLRLKHQAVIEKADRNRRLLGRDQQGRILPAPDSDAFSAASDQADSPAPLIGQVVGLTLLIQFPDVPATISQANINNYCNQVGYTGYGNNGSVRDYFYGVSNSNLTYTNYVTAYYTAQYNRSYYTDPNISYGTRARELIKEALLWLDNPSGQNFNFGTISVDGGNYMLAINAFYAGNTVNNWAQGLWPHMSSMYGMFTSNEGVKSGVYQITNIGSSLALGTFCHENGHMICGYPDLYDYGYESHGAGNYCLMAYGGSAYNPIPPNPYLRDIKGWESVTVFPHLSGVQYFLQSNSNTSYKYLNPGNSEEFFYIDSRTKTGRNSSLPDDGLVIWHIDENGSNNNEQMTPTQHYMVSVEQADGLFHLEYGSNAGGSGDLFHTGYKDIFNDTVVPNARWWNGDNSNLVIRQISAVGSTMSFVYDDGTVPQPPVAEDGGASTQINTPVTITLVATDEGLPNPPGTLTYIITSLPSSGELSDPGAGGITAVPYTLAGNGSQVIYTPDVSFAGSDSFQFKANDGGTSPEGGDSNIATVSISVIDAIYMANMDTNPGWTLDSLWQWGTPAGSGGAEYGNPDPTAGYTGAKVVGYNLLGDYENSIATTRWAKTPAINCTNRTGVTLTFYRWLNVEQPAWDHAYIQVSNNGSTWSTIWQNSSEITDSGWTLQTFDISAAADNQPTVYIRWGMGPTDSSWQYSGWNIDDVKVTGIAPVSYTLTVNSSGASSVSISSSTGHGGTTNYTKTVTSETPVTLTAPSTAGGKQFTGWTGNVTSSNQTISFSMNGHKTVTANFNAKPVADINAAANVLVITDANSVTLDATGSTDDGLPNPPGILTYHWEKVSGPDTCAILHPDVAVTDVLFWGLGSYEFSVTVSDGQLQDVESATVDVVVDVAYVASDGDDNTGLGTIENPFATIQRAMDVVRDNGTVIVLTGTYYENIDFGGRKITVKSVDPDDPCVVADTVIDANGSGSVVTFNSGEDANSVLGGFTITGGSSPSGGGIYISSASPVIEKNVLTGNSCSLSGSALYSVGGSAAIRLNNFLSNSGNWATIVIKDSNAVFVNNVIADNVSNYDAGLYCYGGQPIIKNNTFADNKTLDTFELCSTGILLQSNNPNKSAAITNNIICYGVNGSGVYDWGDGAYPPVGHALDANLFTYNNVYGNELGNYTRIADQTGVNGNISVNPLFADTAANDYHLKSQAGRWDPNSQGWVYDDVTSPCIDGGDPDSDWTAELWPHGKRINMGAYGGTPEASMSLSGIGNITNLDNDPCDIVDFKDLGILTSRDWLKEGMPTAGDINRDAIVNLVDYAIFAEHWLEGI